MLFSAATLDDLLKKVYEALLKSKVYIHPSKGPAQEITGALLQISNPRARLSRTEKRSTLFSCLGEFLWYLSKTNQLDFIEYYISAYSELSDDGSTIHGGYGLRLFDKNGIDQIENIISILKSRPDSRQAVIQLFDATDLVGKHKDIPCTCTLQFMVRDHKLHMMAHMRSNDVFLGLPHDVFAFTMLQEIIAATLGVGLGKYIHSVGSLHLYEKDIEAAKSLIAEGWQSKIAMPSMPSGDPWPALEIVLDCERRIRTGETIDISELKLNPYWQDLVRLLQILKYIKDGKRKDVIVLKDAMASKIYETYITKRQTIKSQISVQEPLPFGNSDAENT